jgi:ankyrin repeat protein
LHIAVRQRSKPLVIQALLRLHADCGARNSDEDTALLAALGKGDPKHLLEIVRLLIIKSNPADCDKEGNTACHLAVRLVQNYDVFEEIVAHCSSFLETANSAGQVVLYCATVHRNLAAIELLLKYNVDMYKKARDTEDTKSIIATVLAGKNGFMQLIFAKYIDESSSK